MSWDLWNPVTIVRETDDEKDSSNSRNILPKKHLPSARKLTFTICRRNDLHVDVLSFHRINDCFFGYFGRVAAVISISSRAEERLRQLVFGVGAGCLNVLLATQNLVGNVADFGSAWGLNDESEIAGTYIQRLPCDTCGFGLNLDILFIYTVFVAEPKRFIRRKSIEIDKEARTRC